MNTLLHISQVAAHAILVAALAVACVTDVRRHKVHNWLTVPAALLGFALGAAGGGAGVVQALGGLAAGFCAGLIFMVFFRSGAGDAKLLIAVGALTSARFLLGTALYGAVAALPVALFLMWRRGVFAYTLANLTRNAALKAVGAGGDVAAGSKAGKMPYAVAIAAGALITWLIHGWPGMGLGGA